MHTVVGNYYTLVRQPQLGGNYQSFSKMTPAWRKFWLGDKGSSSIKEWMDWEDFRSPIIVIDPVPCPQITQFF